MTKKDEIEPKSKYDIEAEDFLNSTNTKFKAEFIKHGKHFGDEKETRDIYKITLTRKTRSYIFEFGASINDSGFKVKLNNGVTAIKYTDERDINKITKMAKKKFYSLNGLTIVAPKAPTPYDVLACLQKSEIGTFEDFCSDFGYSTDSIKATKIYEAVQKEVSAVQALFSDEEMERLQEIQ